MKVSRMNAAIVVILFFRLVPVQGQKAWEKKPYQEWTVSEVAKILSDSPWAQTAYETSGMTYNLPGVSYSATIRLRSALPIRQALVRQRQLLINYDKLDVSDKKTFDAETKEFLECSDCAKYYIVTMATHAPAGYPPMNLAGTTMRGSYGVDIGAPLRKLTLNDLKAHVHLSNDRGERRALVGYIPAAAVGKEAMFIFPRLDDQGVPLIIAKHKALHFETDGKVFSNMPAQLKKFSFAVHRLIQNGQIVF